MDDAGDRRIRSEGREKVNSCESEGSEGSEGSEYSDLMYM